MMSYLKYRCDKDADNSGIAVFRHELEKDTDEGKGQSLRAMHDMVSMNIGSPAPLVADLMRNVDSSKFECVLAIGYRDENESEYLELCK